MVVVDGAALVFGIDVFKHHVLYHAVVLEAEFGAEHHVFEVVEHVATLLLRHPFCTFSVAVVVELQHGGVVFKELVGIKRQLPYVGIVVDACYP